MKILTKSARDLGLKVVVVVVFALTYVRILKRLSFVVVVGSGVVVTCDELLWLLLLLLPWSCSSSSSWCRSFKTFYLPH